MSQSFAERVQRIKPSPTFAIAGRAAELRAQGESVIALSVGEPDFDTPDHIKNAAIKAIQDGFTKYTPVDGIASLKQAIIKKFATENQLIFEANQILVSVGAKQSLYNLFQALLKAGDEVIIPAPYWVSYPAMAHLADATPIIIDTNIDAQFKITPEQLEATITPKSRLFVLNSPSNPSGMAYTADEMRALGEVLKQHPQIWVACDDIYEHILWTGSKFVSMLNVCPELADRTVVINGVSKAFSMTGWRIGYAGGPASIISAMKKVQSQSTSNPCSISQVAAQAALEGGTDCVKPMVKAFKERHDMLNTLLNDIPGFKCIPVDGTFYAYPDISEAIKLLGVADDVAFAEKLLNDVKVALVPGSAFGTPGYIRFSYAADEKTLQDAVERIQTMMSS